MSKLHMIGNAHIDPVWLWQWQEGFHEVKATFRSALDRMKEYAGVYLHRQLGRFLRMGRAKRPGDVRRDPARVCRRALGASSAAGGSSRTAISRAASPLSGQALYGQRYFKEKFGVTAHGGL